METAQSAISNPTTTIASTSDQQANPILPLTEDEVDEEEDGDLYPDPDNCLEDGRVSSQRPKSGRLIFKLPIAQESQPPKDASSNAKLLTQLVSTNLKLFQDNIRLKKFCTNFKLYLEKYSESAESDSVTKSTVEGITSKYEQNYGNIQLQLFNDTAGIKTVIEKLNYTDQTLPPLTDSTNSRTTSPSIQEQSLFSLSQSLLVRLENDASFEDSLCRTFRDENCHQPLPICKSATSETKSHFNLRRRRDQAKLSSMSTAPCSPKKLFTCTFCLATFSYLSTLSQHLVREHNESAYTCFACNRKFKSKTHFARHFHQKSCSLSTFKEDHHVPRICKRSNKVIPCSAGTHPFSCDHCSLTFKRCSYLNKHLKGVHGDKLEPDDIEAKECEELDDQTTLTVDESANPNLGSPKSYYCCLCKESFPASIFLVDHIKAFHTENVCVTCNKQFKVRSCLNRHIKESSCGTREPKRSFSCTFCAFPFKRVTHLHQHILRKHSGDPSLQLVVEKFSETIGEGSNQNVDDNDNDEDNLGDIDEVEAEQEEPFDEAPQADDDMRPLKIKCYTCDWVNCGKTFVNRSLVAHHIRIVHKNERHHPCVWPGCEQAFKRPINLRHHLATHTGVCNYKCTVGGCTQGFRNPGSLYVHRRRHQLEGTLPTTTVIQVAGPREEEEEEAQQMEVIQFSGNEQTPGPVHYLPSYNLSSEPGKSTQPQQRQFVIVPGPKAPLYACPLTDCTARFVHFEELQNHTQLTHLRTLGGT